jgi:hypothetical protein
MKIWMLSIPVNKGKTALYLYPYPHELSPLFIDFSLRERKKSINQSKNY